MSGIAGEAAEQVVRMSLEGTEMAVKLAGSGAKEIAVLIYAVLKDQQKTRGRIRLTNMLRSGKEIKVFAVKDSDLQRFCAEAKKYGVLYTVLKDRDAKDGLTDLMVRAEDAGKINRIFERFRLSTVDMGSVKAQIGREITEMAEEKEPQPKVTMTKQEKVETFLDEALGGPGSGGKENANPEEGRTARSRQSEPSSEKKQPTARDASEEPERRPSVKKELADIRREQKETAERNGSRNRQRTQTHKAPKKKRKRTKREARQ